MRMPVIVEPASVVETPRFAEYTAKCERFPRFWLGFRLTFAGTEYASGDSSSPKMNVQASEIWRPSLVEALEVPDNWRQGIAPLEEVVAC